MTPAVQVVGINSQIYSNSGGFQGVSFAIPINVAVQIKDQIVKTGKVEHARLGVEVQPLNQSLADSFKLTSPNGALVAKVVPDSAAAQAGIKVGDVILKFNGAPVIDAGSLSQKVGMATPGEKASIEIWRNGKTLDLTATIGNAATLTADNNDSGGSSSQAKLGLALRPLEPGGASTGRRPWAVFWSRMRRAAQRTRGSSRATWCCRSMALRSKPWRSCARWSRITTSRSRCSSSGATLGCSFR